MLPVDLDGLSAVSVKLLEGYAFTLERERRLPYLKSICDLKTRFVSLGIIDPRCTA
jgi:hypothetical protein